MKIEYPCQIAPGGVCPDCTNDGPLCDFDMCPYEEEFFNQWANVSLSPLVDNIIDKAKEGIT